MRKKTFFLAAVFTMLISTTLAGFGSRSDASPAEFDSVLTEITFVPAGLEEPEAAVEDSVSKRDALVEEVSRYLRDIKAPKDVSANYIVECCLENDFDISFLLAQGTLETGMGSAGIGKSRKSLFGVYRTFPTRNESVSFYVKLVKSKYMKPGKSYEQLLRRYVTNSGARYAQNPKYESELKSKYREVLRKYSIHDIQFN